jgi:aarF domain-containing kinase
MNDEVLRIADAQELIFLTRCQRMMQANNQTLGSPSSRVNLTAKVRRVCFRLQASHARFFDTGRDSRSRLRLRRRMSLSLPLTPQWASIGYARATPPDASWPAWFRARFDAVVFRLTLGVVDLAFLGTQIKQCEWETGLRRVWSANAPTRADARRSRTGPGMGGHVAEAV